MNRFLHTSLFCFVLFGCGSTPPADAPGQPEMPEPAPTPISSEPIAEKPAEPVKPPPTAEELKKAEEAKKLEADRVKMRADHQAEVARFTPELRAQAKALAEKTYPNARAAIQAALAGKHRKPANAERDGDRHALQMLEFMGFKP